MKFLLYILLLPIFYKSQNGIALHVDGSILLTCGFTQLHYNLTDKKNQLKSTIIGALSSLIVGIGFKEYIHDKFMNRGVFSNQDILADYGGTIMGAMIITCKFDLDRNGLILKKHSPRKISNKKYILD